MTQKITWAPLVPLIGGQMLGAERAFGNPPEAVYSYDGFAANDGHYLNYQNVTHTKGLEYVLLDAGNGQEPRGQVDVVSGTPPCAALSQLNTGKSEEVKGSGCAKNEWMYKVFEDGIDRLGAKVVVVENAPALYTKKGQGVAENLYKICEERGYSLTLYKTSSKYHGLPQARDRTFAVGWKSPTAPVMNWFKEDRKSFKDHLAEIPEGALQHDLIINKNIDTEPYYKFIKAKTNRDPREVCIEEDIKSTFQWVQRNGMLEEANKWFKDTNNEKGVKLSDHAIMKFADGKGIWDGSVHVFGEYMNAVIGRNMVDSIHPVHERSMTIREALHMMGFPEDFELVGGVTKVNHIAQNVPVPTSASIHGEIAKFLRGELELSDTTFLRQNNHKEEMLFDPLGKDMRPNLTEFYA